MSIRSLISAVGPTKLDQHKLTSVSGGPYMNCRTAQSADGQIIVAVIQMTGVYRSTNGGATWVELIMPFRSGWHSVALSSDGMTILVTSATGGGLVVSRDGGQTWISHYNGHNNIMGASMSADGAVMAVSRHTYGIITSRDFGATWTYSTNADNNCISIAVSGNGALIYCGTTSGPLYRSQDSGVSWTTAHATSSYRACVTTSFTGDEVIYGEYPGGLWRSTNRGGSWVSIEGSGSKYWSSVAKAANANTIAASQYGSTFQITENSGSSWVSIGNMGTSQTNNTASIHVSISGNGNKVIIGTAEFNSLIYNKPTNSQSIINLPVACLRCGDISDDGRIFGSMSNKLYVREPNGTWLPYVTTSSSPTSIVTDSAGVNALVNPPGYVMSKSQNGGLTWSSGGHPGGNIVVYLTMSADGSTIAAASREGVRISRDTGVTWAADTRFPRVDITKIAMSRDGSVIAASTPTISGTSSAVHVARNNVAVTTIPKTNATLQALSMSPDSSKLLVGIQYGELYRSNDGGSSWVSLPNAGAKFWIDTAITNDGSMFTLNGYGDITKSVDGGTTWTPVNQPPRPLLVNVSAQGSMSISGSKLLVVTPYGSHVIDI